MTKQLEKQRKLNHAAMAYLQVWSKTDCAALASIARCAEKPDQKEMVKTLRRLAIAYKVVRGISAKDADGNKLSENRKLQRWGEIACIVQDIAGKKKSAHALVHQLSTNLAKFSSQKNATSQKSYSLISASSKLLWFFPKTKVKIYDSQAVKALRHEKTGLPSGKIDYEDYVKCWETCISNYKCELDSAVEGLPDLLPWTSVPYEKHAAACQAISQPWFRERIFDQYLWATGSPTDNKD